MTAPTSWTATTSRQPTGCAPVLSRTASRVPALSRSARLQPRWVSVALPVLCPSCVTQLAGVVSVRVTPRVCVWHAKSWERTADVRLSARRRLTTLGSASGGQTACGVSASRHSLPVVLRCGWWPLCCCTGWRLRSLAGCSPLSLQSPDSSASQKMPEMLPASVCTPAGR